MSIQYTTFQVDDRHLSSIFHYPKIIMRKQTPAIVFVHGFVGNKVGEHRLFVKAARYFSDRGYIVFRFDFGGCGESDGDYKEVTLSRQINELKKALDFVASSPYVDPENITVVGHSLGGAVSSLTVPSCQHIQKLVLWSPVAEPYKNITDITGEKVVQEAIKNGVSDYHGFYLSGRFFKDLKNHHPLQSIQNYDGYLLVIHAENDEQVPKENGLKYYHAACQQKTIHLIKNSDHTFSSYTFEEELFSVTYAWLEQFRASIQYSHIG